MQEWLTTTFTLTSDGLAIVYQDADLFVVVDPVASTAAGGIFASISAAPPTHATLSALTCASTGNWQRIFDQWKADGKVS